MEQSGRMPGAPTLCWRSSRVDLAVRSAEAELWLGAHPADPARVDVAGSGESLLDVISADPLGQLGETNASRFGGRLPFLLKVLAAEEPLSLQAHPNSMQAREGFERENADGVPLDSPARNYKDDNHKPELVVALTKFEALAGFRDVRRTVGLLRALGVAELDRCAELLAAQANSSGVRALFTQWITGDEHSATLIGGVVEACQRYLCAEPTAWQGSSRPRRKLRSNWGVGIRATPVC